MGHCRRLKKDRHQGVRFLFAEPEGGARRRGQWATRWSNL
jgi:hypothetical protein